MFIDIKMEQCMKEILICRIRRKELVVFSLPKDLEFMRVCGKKINLMDWEFFITKMDLKPLRDNLNSEKK